MHLNEIVINEYVDHTLGPDQRRDVEQHIDVCATCRALVDDLAALTRAAAALDAIDPPSDAWSRLERTIRSDRSPRLTEGRGETRWWRWAAAAAVLVAAVGIGLRFGPRPGSESTVPSDSHPPRAITAATVESELRQAEAHYENAIRGLEEIANAETNALDPVTVATLRKNLLVIDQAINESRAAVRAQPNSEPAQASLFESFKAKIAFLQDTVALVNEVRRGNGAGAARIASRLQKG